MGWLWQGGTPLRVLTDREIVGLMKDILIRWLFNGLYPRVCAVLRLLCPLPRIGRYLLVTRFDDVQEVLARSEEFVVPYRQKIIDIGWLPLYFLAHERRDDAYFLSVEAVHALWTNDDLVRVRAIADEVTSTAIHQGLGRVDAMTDVVVPSALAIVERYYGIKIREPAKFVAVSCSVAAYIFGEPSPGKAAIVEARSNLEYVWTDIDAAMASAVIQADAGEDEPETTVVGRWARERRADIAPDAFRSLMTHMIMGFIPAHTNGAGRALHVILSRESARCTAVSVARAGGRAITQVAYEALRFLYILPIVWRTNESIVELRRDTSKPVQIPANTIVAVSSLSAMQDSRRLHRPQDFRADRAPYVYLTFGYDFHYCIGRAISDELLAANLGGLFAADGRRQPGRKTVWNGMIPCSIPMRIQRQGESS
jgi:cytochrome P450